jgi:hypothetical protein
MIFAPLSIGVNVALNISLPDGLARREFCAMANSTAEVGGGASNLFTRATNTGLPIMAVIKVTTALMIATKTGVSNFFSGFFSFSGAGCAGFSLWGVGCSFEDGEEESEVGIIGHRGPFMWRKCVEIMG